MDDKLDFLINAKTGKHRLMDDSDELLTIDGLAEKLKVPKSFLYSPARRKGPDAIPCIKIGKYLRYHLPSVRAHLIKQNQRCE